MIILAFKSKSLTVKWTGMVRISNDAIISCGSREGEVMVHPPACKQKWVSNRLPGARGERGRGLVWTGHIIRKGIGNATPSPFQSSTTASNNAIAFYNLVPSGSLERTSGSQDSCDGVANVENTVLTEMAVIKRHEKTIRLFFSTNLLKTMKTVQGETVSSERW